jgi:hypothetical protein
MVTYLAAAPVEDCITLCARVTRWVRGTARVFWATDGWGGVHLPFRLQSCEVKLLIVASYKNESNLLLVRITVCIESFLPIGWRTFIWCCTILVWIAGCWSSSNILLTSYMVTKKNVDSHFWSKVWRKDLGLCPYKLWSEQAGGWIIFIWSGLELWSLFEYSKPKLKNQPTVKRLMTFYSLSNGTTLMQIQSGQTVPLSRCRGSPRIFTSYGARNDLKSSKTIMDKMPITLNQFHVSDFHVKSKIYFTRSYIFNTANKLWYLLM